MPVSEKPAIAITMGDPCGIGPEVVVKALADPSVYATCRPLVVGNIYAMHRAVELTGIPLRINAPDDLAAAGQDRGMVDVLDINNLNPEDITVGEISPTCGKAAMEWVTKAGELALAGVVDGMATAPLNKEAASLAGYESIGHSELLQELAGVKTVATMLLAKNLRVVHLTTHRSLRLACDYVKKDRILEFLQLTHDNFVTWGFKNPRIGAAALNPHNSDGGLLGSEEAEEIAPAVEAAANEVSTLLARCLPILSSIKLSRVGMTRCCACSTTRGTYRLRFTDSRKASPPIWVCPSSVLQWTTVPLSISQARASPMHSACWSPSGWRSA